VIARTSEAVLNLPIALSANIGSRRVGSLDLSQQVPLVNDYRIRITNKLDALRKSGVTRANYVIQNVSSRLQFKGLQLVARVKDGRGVELSQITRVIGPNPQYLMPLSRGRSVNFLVPINVMSEIQGGTLELELMEDGNTVTIHQAKF
jgi:hypothetical protein